MATLTGTHQLGPQHGRIQLRTTREGLAAKVGHDLLIELPSWSGTLTANPEDSAASTLEVEIDLTSITIVSGTGGVTELSDKDKAEIAKNAGKALEVDRHPSATFTAKGIPPSTASGQIEGSLTLHGITKPFRLKFDESSGSTWQASAEVIQSDFGIKPYRAMLGALRLADPVTVNVEIRLDGA